MAVPLNRGLERNCLNTVFFDLDGTLVDTSKAIFLSLHEAARACGFEATFKLECFGLQVKEIFLNSIPNLSAEELEVLNDCFRLHQDSVALEGWHPYPGFDELLAYLRNESIPFYVITNRPRTGVLNLINSGFSAIPLNRYYSVGYLGLDSKVKLLDHVIEINKIDRSRCVAFGDQPKDVEAAISNGIKGVFCSHGFGTLKGSPHLKEVETVSSLLMARRLIESLRS